MNKILKIFAAFAIFSFAFPAFAGHNCTPVLSTTEQRTLDENVHGHPCSNNSGTLPNTDDSNTRQPTGTNNNSQQNTNQSSGASVQLSEPPSDIRGLFAGDTPLSAQNGIDILTEIRNFLMIAGIVVVVIMLIWSGITYITSQGDPEKVAAAKQRFIWAIIGTAILLATFIIISTIRTILDQRSIFTSV